MVPSARCADIHRPSTRALRLSSRNPFGKLANTRHTKACVILFEVYEREWNLSELCACWVCGVEGTDAPVAILYGAPGTPCFAPFHALLRDAPGVGYVLRPVLRHGCAGDGCTGFGGSQEDDSHMLPLAGYGVSLNIKNMEYKAQNDEEVKAEHDTSVAAAGGGKDGGEEEDVRGFMFRRLVERHPALKGELDTFRDHLLSNANQEVRFAPCKPPLLESPCLFQGKPVLIHAHPARLSVGQAPHPQYMYILAIRETLRGQDRADHPPHAYQYSTGISSGAHAATVRATNRMVTRHVNARRPSRCGT
jgi:hypothetical protein